MKFIEINDEIINLAFVRKISKTSNINGRYCVKFDMDDIALNTYKSFDDKVKRDGFYAEIASYLCGNDDGIGMPNPFYKQISTDVIPI